MKLFALYFLAIWLFIPQFLSLEHALEFLHPGENIEFTNKLRSERVSLTIIIDFSVAQGKQIFSRVDTLLSDWGEYPAFNDTEHNIGSIFLSLIETAVRNVIIAATLLEKVVSFVDEQGTINQTYKCFYAHKMVTLEDMETQVTNLESTHKKIDKAWTAASIIADLNKDTALRNYALLIDEVAESWAKGFNEMLSTLDYLASNKIPPEIMGHYQAAKCIGNAFEEDITVLRCFGTKLGYNCDLDIDIPLTFSVVTQLEPIHYNDIRIRGDTVDQLFVTTPNANDIKLISCDHYEFHTENLPNCETYDLDKDCVSALKGQDYRLTIRKCNWTNSVPNMATRVKDNAILVQGVDTISKVKQNTEYAPLTSTTPVLIQSPFDILVQQHHEEIILPALNSNLTSLLTYSRLSKEDITYLESQLTWQTFLEDFDMEDLTRYIILFLQVVLYPVVLVGIGLTIKARRHLLERLAVQKRIKKNNLKTNKIMLKRLKHQNK